jgi:transcriptional regulator with XRE-family HTH domain
VTSTAPAGRTTAAAGGGGAGRNVSLCFGLLLDAVFGTSAAMPLVSWVDVTTVTTTPEARQAARFPGVAQEVRELRDRIRALGLTRQDIARGVGVDRRSLSGWVRGETRPADDRVVLLRVLARLVADIDDERPGRARDVLLARNAGRPLIERIASEGSAILETWRAAARPASSVTVTRRPVIAGEPIWAAAARALAGGRVAPLARERTVRPAATYEMDLAEAGAHDEPEIERGRRGYQ